MDCTHQEVLLQDMNKHSTGVISGNTILTNTVQHVPPYTYDWPDLVIQVQGISKRCYGVPNLWNKWYWYQYVIGQYHLFFGIV